MTARPLTERERDLARSIFGQSLELDRVRVNRRKWWPFQPRNVMMAPDGELWCHPHGTTYLDCFASVGPAWQGFLIHELTHVWQAQRGGRWYLPLVRHPFCRYGYRLVPGRPFHRYGIEQQAEIVRYAFLLRRGVKVAGAAPLEAYEGLLPFG
jgi:hypothetical protein